MQPRIFAFRPTVVAIIGGLLVAWSLFLLQNTFISFEKQRLPLDGLPAAIEEDPLKLFIELKRDTINNSPFLVIEVRNDSKRDATTQLLVNRSAAGNVTLPAAKNQTNFVRLTPSMLRIGRNRILIQGNTGVTVQRMELRNVLGYSEGGLFSFYVVDRNQEFERASPWWLLLPAITLLFIFSIRGKTAKFYAPLIVCTAIVVAMLIVPVVSSLKVILPLKTYIALIAVSLLPFFREVYLRVRKRSEVAALNIQTISVFVITLLCFGLITDRLLDQHGGNYSGLIHFSSRVVKRCVLLQGRQEIRRDLIQVPEGYDAQFYYFISFDPLIRTLPDTRKYSWCIDSPVFRYRRIGFPLLIHAFSGGAPERFPVTMVLLILVFQGLAALFLALLARSFGRSSLWGLLYLAVPAFQISMNFALPEPLSATLLLAALYFYRNRNLVVSTLCFTLLLLVRETGAIVWISVVIHEMFQLRNRKGGLLLASAFIPYAAWRIYVSITFWSIRGWSGLFLEGSNFTLPFAGIISMLAASRHGVLPEPWMPAAIAFPVILLVIFLTSIYFLKIQRNYLTVCLFLYSLLSIGLSYPEVWAYPGNAERQTFEIFLLLIVAFFSLPRRRALNIAAIGFCLMLIVYDFFFFTENSIYRGLIGELF